MTAESLKPFISLPSAENFSSHKRSSLNLITIGIGATFVTLSIVLLGYTIWNSVRIHELQKEVNSLNRVVVEMQKRLGFNHLADFNELDDTYDNILVDDPIPYNQDEDEDLDDNDNDDDDEDDDDEGNSEEERIRDGLDYIDDDILDGSGLYDDDDEDDDDGADDSSYENEFAESSIDKIERKTRSIASSSNGIPIYQDSYALKRNRTGGPEDERIEQHLLASKGFAPTLRYDWSEKSPRPASSTTDDSIHARRGRYPNTPGNGLRSLHQPRQRVYRPHRNQRLLRPLLKSGKGRGKSQALTARALPTLTAVHYHLNSTISGKHNLRPEHSKLPHDGDVYIGSPLPWARALGLDKAFSLDHGVLTIKEPGLYFIYAQIYYDNRYDRNGFVVYHNVQPFLQCALFVPTNINKSHTCYTSGVIYLEGNDELHLRDIHQDRGVMLSNAKSFIGIIKLGEI